MAKKKKNCWFGWLKRLFVSEEKSKKEKKSKKWRWIRFVQIKFKQEQHHALPSLERRTIDEATEKQRKYAMTVAIATAAAAEAAVAAAKAAAEVVRLTTFSQSCHLRLTNTDQKHSAAIKIQTAFRAHLARKALRALKGLVKLQAIVRGRAVRSKVVMKLERFPSSTKLHLQGKAKGYPGIDGIFRSGEYKHFISSDMESKGKNQRKDSQLVQMLESKSHRCWDYSALSKEDMETLWMKRQEASIKRDRMMKYSFSHRDRRNSQTLEECFVNKETGKQSHWWEQPAEKETYMREAMENLKPISVSNLSTSDIVGSVHVKTRKTQKQDSMEGLNSPISFPRRSFCRTQRSSLGTDGSIPNSPVFPTYMAATESAKAKARSMSTPRQRLGIQEAFLDHSLSHKNGLSLWSSYDSDVLSLCGKNGASQSIPRQI